MRGTRSAKSVSILSMEFTTDARHGRLRFSVAGSSLKLNAFTTDGSQSILEFVDTTNGSVTSLRLLGLYTISSVFAGCSTIELTPVSQRRLRGFRKALSLSTPTTEPSSSKPVTGLTSGNEVGPPQTSEIERKRTVREVAREIGEFMRENDRPLQ